MIHSPRYARIGHIPSDDTLRYAVAVEVALLVVEFELAVEAFLANILALIDRIFWLARSIPPLTAFSYNFKAGSRFSAGMFSLSPCGERVDDDRLTRLEDGSQVEGDLCMISCIFQVNGMGCTSGSSGASLRASLKYQQVPSDQI